MYKSTETSFESTEITTDYEREARDIVANYRYEEALAILRENKLLDEPVLNTKNKYESILNIPDLEITEADWEMLTVLDFYDTDTAEHSIRVFESALYAIQRKLTLNDGSDFNLIDYLTEEGVSKQDFLQAALFHDVGKTIIPHTILKNRTTKDEFDNLFCDYVNYMDSNWLQEKNLIESDNVEDILQDLYAKHKRPIDVLPIKVILPETEFSKLQSNFPYLEINSDTTFRDILIMHEGESERILKSAGKNIAGTIAGQHHNYTKKELVYPRSTSTLRISQVNTPSKLSDILHIVDVSDAIRHARFYKEAQDEFKVLNEIIADTEAGTIDPLIAQAWVQTEFNQLESKINSNDSISPNESIINEKKHILEFLSKSIKTEEKILQ